MRTIAMLFGLFFSLAILGSPAYGQGTTTTPELTPEQKIAQIDALLAQIDANIGKVEAAQTSTAAKAPTTQVAQPATSPRPGQNLVGRPALTAQQVCGTISLDRQPTGKEEAEMILRIAALCEARKAAEIDAETRQREAVDRGALGMEALRINGNLYAKGNEVAVGQAANFAAQGYGGLNGSYGSTFNGWVEGQAYANALLNGGGHTTPPSQPAPAKAAPPAPKPVAPSVPTTPTASTKATADQALADALKE